MSKSEAGQNSARSIGAFAMRPPVSILGARGRNSEDGSSDANVEPSEAEE